MVTVIMIHNSKKYWVLFPILLYIRHLLWKNSSISYIKRNTIILLGLGCINTLKNEKYVCTYAINNKL